MAGRIMVESLKKWHRWFRFRLRTLLVAWLVIGASVGWWIQSSRQQRDAVANIHRLTARAVIGYSYRMVPSYNKYWPDIDPGAVSWVPRFALDALGEDYFHNVVYVQVDGIEGEEIELATQLARLRNLQRLRLLCEATDVMVARLVGLRELRSLQLWSSNSEDTLRIISRLPRLEALVINWSEFTDAGLAHLARLRTLKSLTLENITDTGLAHLARSSNLEELYILPGLWDRLDRVTGKGVSQLAACPRLRELRLERSCFTDDDLRHFAILNSLESLSLELANINGIGFQHLTGLTDIKRVYLENTPITDEAITYLAQLPDLEAVDLRGTEVTITGLEHFATSPKLRWLVVTMPSSTKLGRVLDQLSPVMKAILGPEIGVGHLTVSELERLRQALPHCKIDDYRDF